MRRILVLFCVLAGMWGGWLLAAQTAPPPSPQHWVTDGPAFLTPAALETLDQRLEAYQKGTGHQVLVWIGTTTAGDPLEDWTVRAFAAWKVGRAGLDDGLVIFIFTGDRKVRLEVGYGLEGQLPDAVASRIIQETILPRIKAGDADGAMARLGEAVARGLKDPKAIRDAPAFQGLVARPDFQRLLEGLAPQGGKAPASN